MLRRDNPCYMNVAQFRAFMKDEHPSIVGEMVFEVAAEALDSMDKVYPQTMHGFVYVLGWINGFAARAEESADAGRN